jgi:2-polyprenyl-3-methyl-5-hydroxy-6-metoxy-1,4-benzoquinol methylase
MAEALTKKGTDSHANEIASGERFEFGKNWSRFLSLLDDERIAAAETSLKKMLGVESLEGKSFLDIGSGSGLFSLVARRLGARVHSFDYDPQSVACTAELRRRYFAGDERWTVEQGSALDGEYLKSLGTFDVVYSWGVLHHTGQMWRALENALLPVAEGGKLFIAIYNDTGSQSARWKWIKRTYNSLPRFLRLPFTLVVIAPGEGKSVARALLTLRLRQYIESWTRVSMDRGMSRWRDIVDWVGGYPYEVATPEEIFDFYQARGFALSRLKCGRVGLGCNEFVFVKEASQARPESDPVDLQAYRGIVNHRDFKSNGNGFSKTSSTSAR